jgi:hypothetical protein
LRSSSVRTTTQCNWCSSCWIRTRWTRTRSAKTLLAGHSSRSTILPTSNRSSGNNRLLVSSWRRLSCLATRSMTTIPYL